MHHVYLLKSTRKKWFYIGTTEFPNKRVEQHNAGKVRSTKAYAPFYIIYYEAYLDKTAALKREL